MGYGKSRVYVIGSGSEVGSGPEVDSGPAGMPVPPAEVAEPAWAGEPLIPVRATGMVAGSRNTRDAQTPPPAKRSAREWWSLLMPSVLGPIAAAIRLGGRSRIVWAAAAAVPLAGMISLVAFGPAIRGWVQTARFGVLAWLLLLAIGTVSGAAAWALGSHAATRKAHRRGTSRNEDPAHVGALGFLFPGFGLRMARCHRLAAAALGTAILGVGAAIFVANVPWLWMRLRSGSPAGITATAFEVALLVAVGVLTVSVITWIVQGLDGARRVARQRSPLLTDAVSASLLVAIVVFALAFRPTSVASNLHSMASALDAQGFRVIPLALCEASARLDRATPIYIADAADLLDSLGRHEEAQRHRRVIERKMTEYIEALGTRDGFLRVSYESAGGTLHPAPAGDGGTAWERTAALYE